MIARGWLALALAVAPLLWFASRSPLDTIVPLHVGANGALPLTFWSVFVSETVALAFAARAVRARALVAGLPAGAAAHVASLLARVGPGEAGAYGAYVVVAETILAGALVAVAARPGMRALRAVRPALSDALWVTPLGVIGIAALDALRGGQPWVLIGAVIGAALVTTPFAIAPALLARARAVARDDRVLLVAVVFVGFAARILFGLRIVQQTGTAFPLASADGPSYDEAAWAVVSGAPMEDPGARWPRGYWTFVAAVYRLFGHEYLALSLVQGTLAAFTPALTFFAFRRIFGRPVAVLASLGVALSGTLIFVAAVLGTEGLYALAAAGAIAAIVAMTRSSGWRAAAAAGACLGLATAIKPQTLPFAVFVIVWMLAGGAPPAARWRHALAAAGGAAAALAPFVLADVAAFGRPLLFAAGGSDAFSSPIGDAWRAIGVDPYRDGWPQALLAAAARPGDAWAVLARFVPDGLQRYLFGDWFGTFDPLFLERQSDFAKQLRLYGYVLTLVGVVAAFARLPGTRWHQAVLLAFVATQTVAPVLLGIPQVRYRVPSDPYFLAYLSYGLLTVGAAAAFTRPAPRATRI